MARRAPSAWVLGQTSVHDSLYESKQGAATPPTLVASDADAACGSAGLLSQALTPGCNVRAMPREWASECPLRVGGNLPCWQLASSGAAAFHGCAGTRRRAAQSATGAAAAAAAASGRRLSEGSRYGAFSSLSDAVESIAGAGPPNPQCLSIFPPSWRMADWFVFVWVKVCTMVAWYHGYQVPLSF
jgi:hypothetical protein